MEVLLVRHAETEQNARKRVQGQGHGKLSLTGLKQVEKLAKDLASEKIDYIYTSDLGRCVKTAETIHKFHTNKPLILKTELREFKFGIFTGLPASWFWWARGAGSKVKIKIPGFETTKDVTERIVPFMNHLLKAHPNKRLVIVSHGGPIRILRALIEERPLKELLDEEIPNCSVWRLKVTKPLKIS